MTISATDVFDKVAEYVRKNEEKLESIEMPYCSLTKEYPSQEKVYRVELKIKIKGEPFPKSAIANVDSESGNIIMYKTGYTWQYWTG